MTNIITEMLKEVIANCNIKHRVNLKNLEREGIHTSYGTPHIIYRYHIKKENKIIYFEYDEYRNLIRDINVYTNWTA